MSEEQITAGVDDPATLDPAQVRAVLSEGELSIIGRLTDASNLSMVAHAALDGVNLACVYKPIRGERPLWDFPDGTLAGREVASALVASAAGWQVVPPTLLRGGPLGTGMVQLWIEEADSESAIDLFPAKELPDGWLPVFRAVGEDGLPLVLAHVDEPKLALLAAFDLVVNNADRKAPHVLPIPGGPVYGVDHGLTMHVEDKLRTVLWGWAGEPLPEQALDGLRRLQPQVVDPDSQLSRRLETMLTVTEMVALSERIDTLLATGVYNEPPIGRTAIPWPPL